MVEVLIYKDVLEFNNKETEWLQKERQNLISMGTSWKKMF